MPSRRFLVTHAPNLVGVPMRERSRGRRVPLLDESERSALAAIGTLTNFPKGATAYRANAPADSLYNLVQGVFKTYEILPDDSVTVAGFHFAGDLFGLAEQGHYAASAEAVVPSVAFRIPLEALDALLARNGTIGMRLLCKLGDELRRGGRHRKILMRNDAIGRFAMFLHMLEELGPRRGPDNAIYFPMSRGDAAQFIGLTLEAMSRASTVLEKARVIRFVDRHHFQIADRDRFEKLVAGGYRPVVTRARTAKSRSAATARKRTKS